MSVTPAKPIDLSDWEEAVAQIREIEETLNQLVEDRPENTALEEFAGGVLETLGNMATWIEENQHVTEKQLGAIGNMGEAVSKWDR